MAAVRFLSPPAWAAEVAALVRKYQQTCPKRLSCWLAATPSSDTSQSASLPSAWAFLIICHAPLAVIVGHTEYMTVSVGSVLGLAQGKGGEGANGGVGMKAFVLSRVSLFWQGWRHWLQ